MISGLGRNPRKTLCQGELFMCELKIWITQRLSLLKMGIDSELFKLCACFKCRWQRSPIEYETSGSIILPWCSFGAFGSRLLRSSKWFRIKGSSACAGKPTEALYARGQLAFACFEKHGFLTVVAKIKWMKCFFIGQMCITSQSCVDAPGMSNIKYRIKKSMPIKSRMTQLCPIFEDGKALCVLVEQMTSEQWCHDYSVIMTLVPMIGGKVFHWPRYYLPAGIQIQWAYLLLETVRVRHVLCNLLHSIYCLKMNRWMAHGKACTGYIIRKVM